MHQGNLKVADDGTILALDFGIMGRIDPLTRPPDADVAGHRIADVFNVTIELRTDEADDILEALGKDEGPVVPREDFDRLKEVLLGELDY
ncbi:MAG: hypothetical protein AAFX76_14255, partial [Planctomycetota bacterium]